MLPALILAAALCPADMVEIPAGTWTFGQDDSGEPWIPAARVAPLDAFCVDRYEYPNVVGELPRVNVGWREAMGACGARGKRLCSADEWERACRGVAATRYAYGTSFEAGRCNTDLEGGHGPEGPPYAAAGANPGCVSPEGAFDLNGNVSEWVADAWDADRFGPAEGQGEGATHRDLRQLRGGTMWGGTFYGQSCLSRHAHPAHTTSDDDGFRCCASLSASAPIPAGSGRGAAITAMVVTLVLVGAGLWRLARRS